MCLGSIVPWVDMLLDRENRAESRTQLNDDCVRLVIKLLSSPDARQLALTSKYLRGLAYKRAHEDVEVSDDEQTRAYCKYMLGEPRRMSFLRQFKLAYATDVKAETVGLLAEVLKNATGLHGLNLDRIEGLLRLDPTLGHAITELPGLENLILHDGGTLSIDLFSRLRSRPAYVNHYHSLGELHRFGVDHTPLFTSPALVNVSCLCINGFLAQELGFLSENRQQTSIYMDSWKPLPQLQRLDLYNTDAPLRQIVRLFPNLRILSLAHVRDVFRSAQDIEHWQSLGYVLAQVGDIYTWRIKCPVNCLILQYTVDRIQKGMNERREYSTILWAIRHMRPIILSLDMDLAAPPEFWHKFARKAREVKCMELELQVSGEYLRFWKDEVLPILGQFLDVLCLKISVEYKKPESSGRNIQPERRAAEHGGGTIDGVDAPNDGEAVGNGELGEHGNQPIESDGEESDYEEEGDPDDDEGGAGHNAEEETSPDGEDTPDLQLFRAVAESLYSPIIRHVGSARYVCVAYRHPGDISSCLGHLEWWHTACASYGHEAHKFPSEVANEMRCHASRTPGSAEVVFSFPHLACEADDDSSDCSGD
ncbi:predicted protein [Postia placenta Mad-698-R]|nr:predicted protein [Postia placenta Mad-698-R]